METDPGLDDTVGDESAGAHDETVASSSSGGGRTSDYEQLPTVGGENYADRQVMTRGGMGQIVTARDRRLRRSVAIKELRADTPELRARFEREALLTARLQHPSIVTIYEAGRWGTGEPFYAMRLVPGRPLDRAIAEARDFDVRLGLTPHALAVADAMAYAHEERVIHRDLKPQNVLVGRFGETVVIDWGLAKDLDAEDEPPAPPGDAEPVSAVGETVSGSGSGSGATTTGSLTRVGAVMGTPAYMPPEQARGEIVDERADVYAVGALLYHLLSGRPPYQGSSSDEVLALVATSAPAPLEQVQPGVPRDLVAIVEHAMEREPARRYANASALAEDLRRFLAGQLVAAHRYTAWQRVARWVKRHRAVLAVTAIAVGAVAAVSITSVRSIMDARRRAERAQLAAETSHGHAEELLQFMLHDLRERLEPIGRIDVLEAVANRAEAYYAETPALTAEEAERRIVALEALSDVREEQGDHLAARRQAEKALRIADARSASAPGDRRWTLVGARLQVRLGDLALELDEVPEARAFLERGLALATALGDAPATVASAHVSLGRVALAEGNANGALDAYRAALATYDRMLAASPDDPDALHETASVRGSIAQVLIDLGDVDGANAEVENAVASLRHTLSVDVGNTRALQQLTDTLRLQGGLREERGDLAGTLASYRELVAIGQQLVERDPSNVTWQRNFGVAHAHIGEALLGQGDFEGALGEIETALDIGTELLARGARAPEFRRDVFIYRVRVGEIHLAHAEREPALESFRAALPLVEELSRDAPGNLSLLRDRSVTQFKIGDVLEDLQRYPEARTSFEAGYALAEELARREPDDAQWAYRMSIGHQKLGGLGAAEGDHAGALAHRQEALAIAARLAAKEPESGRYAHNEAVCHRQVAESLRALARRDEAIAEAEQGVTLLAALVEKDPDNVNWEHDLAGAHQVAGQAIAEARGDRDAERRHFAAALEILAKLLAVDPTNAEWIAERDGMRDEAAVAAGADGFGFQLGAVFL